MARGRMISKSLSTSKKYAALYGEPLGEYCQALYPLLVAHADDFGRLEGDAFTVKHSVVPASKRQENDVLQALQLLHDVRLVIWFEHDGSRYLQIVDFERHQGGLHKRTKSRFPRPPGKSGKVLAIPSELKGTEGKGTEGNRTKNSGADAPRSPSENVSIVTKIAHEVIEQLGINSADLLEAIKGLCAKRKIAYDSETVRKALDSAIVQKQRKRA